MQSDINEITVSGRVFGEVKRAESGSATFYECVLKSVFVTPRGATIESYHNVSAFHKGEAGKRLAKAHEGERIVVKGRMTSFRGVSKTTGQPYISFFKINASEISFVEQLNQEARQSANEWTAPPEITNAGFDDIPF